MAEPKRDPKTGELVGAGIPKASALKRDKQGRAILPKNAGAGSANVKKPKRWLGALVQDIEDFGRGLGPGLAYLGKAAYNDLDVVTGDVLPWNNARKNGFMSDDIAKGVGADYVKRYKPLFTDPGKFIDQVARHPLDYLLDAAAVATLGVGAAVSGGVKAASTGAKVGEVAAAAAPKGVFKAAGFVPRTAENIAAAERVYGKASKEIRQGAEQGVVRGVRRVGEGSTALERAAKMNPILRKRDAVVDKALGSAKLANVPAIGLNSRAAREDVRRPALRADVRRKRMLAEPARKLRKLRPDAQAAWFFHHTGSDPREYTQLLRERLEKGDLNDPDTVVLEATIDRITKPEVMDLYDNPTPEITAAVRATKQLADEDMPELMTGLTKMTHRDLLERRMLQERIIDGAEATTVHPENLVPRKDALRDVALAGAERSGVPLRSAPERAQVPGRGAGAPPTAEAVEGLLNAEQRKLVGGRYKVARGALKRWLAEFYDEQRYGGKPDANTIRRETALQQSARARARRKPGRSLSRGEMLDLIAKKGPWSREVARAAQDARELWPLVREERQGGQRLLAGRYPPDSLEAKLLDAGYDPDNPMLNLADDRAMTDVIEEWLDEATGGQSVVDIAYGGADLGMDAGETSGGWMDQATARALVDEAQRMDGDLTDRIDDYDVAQALASKYQQLAEPHSMPTRKEWVDRTFEAILKVYEDGQDAVDAGAELGKIRGSAARALADKLGIRDPDMGIEPDGQDWARALSEIARRSGFDDEYRYQAKVLRGAQQRYDAEGLPAFERAFDREKMMRGSKPRQELVNPETGRLYRDEVAEMSDEELEAAADGLSYFPHRVAEGGQKPTSAAATGTSKRAPGTGSLTHESTGSRFATGNFSMDPMMLIEQGSRLVRSQRASDLYDAAVARGVPFDRAAFHETGGAKNWVVLDQRGVKKLSETLDAEAQQIAEVGELLGETRAAEMIERLRTMTSETDRITKAGDAGELVMVPRGYYEKLAGDMREAGKTAQMIFDRPLDVFRSLVLFATGRYYVNNIVGQGLLLAVHEGGPQFVPAYIRFLAARGRLGAARKLFGEAAEDMDTSTAMWDAVLQKHALELAGASQFDVEMRPGVNSLQQGWAMSDKARHRAFAAFMSVPDNANRIGAYLSDDLPRMFRFQRLIMPHVKAARAAGMDGDDATIAMRLLDQDDVLRSRIIDKTLSDLIDYRGMSHVERVHVRRLIPFYGWLRGISTWTAQLAWDEPEKLAGLAQISEVGQRENEEWNKRTPSWLAGAVRIGGEKDGLQRVVNTQGLNPLSTISDLAVMGRGLVADKADRSLAGGMVLGQINPFARAALAALNGGRDIGSKMPMLTPGQSLSGSSVEPQGVPGLIASAAVGWLATTPQAMLVTQYRTARDNQETYGTPGSPNAVYQSPWSDYVKSYFGLPVRYVNVAAARRRRDREEQLLAGEGRTFG